MTQLVRDCLKTAFTKALTDKNTFKPHPALLLQRGWPQFSQQKSNVEDKGSKTKFIADICQLEASDLYQQAYSRWLQSTSGADFCRQVFRLDNRLLIGVSGGGALETGCALSHNYGVPYIPGSAIKGAMRAWAQQAISEQQDLLAVLFGASDSSSATLIQCYDAWWVPHSAPGEHNNRPLVQDIVTPHHPDYYQGSGADATDLDSPVPNALVAVQGSFVFVLGCAPDYAPLLQIMLQKTLAANGLGAKTAAGYGYFSLDEKKTKVLAQQSSLAKAADLPAHEQQIFRLRHELQALSEEGLALMFSKHRNQTKTRADFAVLLDFVKTEYATQISAWPQKSANFVKAYKFLYQSGNGDES